MLGGAAHTINTTTPFGTIGCFMPYTDFSWRLFRPAEGFYTSEVQTPRRLPIRTFLPTGYEPNYAYPLLVFFHGHGSNEEQILKLAPRLSRRNYICIALRGLQPVDAREGDRSRYSWGPDGACDPAVEDYVFQAVEQTRRQYHVHSERIYLAGIWEGATLSYRMALDFPERFAGVIALNVCMPRRGPLFRLPAIRQLKVFVGHGSANAIAPLALARRDQRLLYTAGLSVRMHTYPTNHRLHPDMLRDVNRWIIDSISDPQAAVGDPQPGAGRGVTIQICRESPGEPDRSEEDAFERRTPRLICRIRDGPRRRSAHADQRAVQPAETLPGRRHEPIRRGRIGVIRDDPAGHVRGGVRREARHGRRGGRLVRGADHDPGPLRHQRLRKYSSPCRRMCHRLRRGIPALGSAQCNDLRCSSPSLRQGTHSDRVHPG